MAKKTWIPVLITIVGIGTWLSGTQFPPWVMSLAAGALGAWIVLTIWQEKQPQAQTPSKEFRDKLLHGSPLNVKHATPKLKESGWGIDDSLHRFFQDFDRFGSIANDWGPIKESPWRLQELEETELRQLSYDSPCYGRQYDIFYNQEQVGSLEITDHIRYTTAEPRISALVGIGDATQLLSFESVNGFLTCIAALLSGSTAEEYDKAKSDIQTALTAAHWNATRNQIVLGSADMEVEVHFGGTSAAHYIGMRAKEEENARKSDGTMRG